MKIGIVAHHSRINMAHSLLKDVTADYISVDHGELGPVANHRRAWNMLHAMADGDEWCFVLEDDSKPVAHFRSELSMALQSLPNGADVLSLYLGRLRPPHWQDRIHQAMVKAQNACASWILGDIVLHGVAVGMRGALVERMMDATKDSPRPMDEAISQWVRRFDHVVAYPIPSLCDHRDGPTLFPHPDGAPREAGRVAWQWGIKATPWTSKAVRL